MKLGMAGEVTHFLKPGVGVIGTPERIQWAREIRADSKHKAGAATYTETSSSSGSASGVEASHARPGVARGLWRAAGRHRGRAVGSPSSPLSLRLPLVLLASRQSERMPASPGSGVYDPFSDLSSASSFYSWFPATKPQPHLPSACVHTQTHSAPVPRKRKHGTHPSNYVSKLCRLPRSFAPAFLCQAAGAKGDSGYLFAFHPLGFPWEGPKRRHFCSGSPRLTLPPVL